MSNLIEETLEALSWQAEEINRHRSSRVFSTLQAGVMWTDRVYHDEVVIGGSNPSEWVSQINSEAWPLYKGHDPGFLIGKVISARLFTSPNGVSFVVGILGMYDDSVRSSFQDLGVSSEFSIASPNAMDFSLDNYWISIGTDPREVEQSWVIDVLKTSPLPTKRDTLSNNAVENSQELIQIGIAFVFLLWNPFVTSIAKEAGKDVYLGVKKWMERLIEKLAELKDPELVIGSNIGECKVSFILRGNDVEQNYKAVRTCSEAAAQAEHIVIKMKEQDQDLDSLVYEFDKESHLWYPSYATCQNGRYISDNKILIGLEQLPTGLSLGIQVDESSGSFKLM